MGTTLDLTDDETAALLRELDNIIANDRYVRRLLIARLGSDAQIRARREALPAPAHRPNG